MADYLGGGGVLLIVSRFTPLGFLRYSETPQALKTAELHRHPAPTPYSMGGKWL
ncbi:unnamed protein product [marine sediment metagenome]|uniref:Uncharacterized protein n=1 Tax=marine sediment metagenome TaxID=412755 RepID=X1ELC5_9ZZZZ